MNQPTKKQPPKGASEYIDHHAIVEDVDTANDSVTVRIDNSSECGECPAASLCAGGGDTSGKLIIKTHHAASFRKGEEVIVRGTEQMHYKAVMLATVIPCIALVAVMLAVYLISGDQLTAALAGLCATVFFFLMLYLMRNKIAHEFSFTIMKL